MLWRIVPQSFEANDFMAVLNANVCVPEIKDGNWPKFNLWAL